MAEVTGPSGRIYVIDEPVSSDADVSFVVGRNTPDAHDVDVTMQDIIFLAAYYESSFKGDWQM